MRELSVHVLTISDRCSAGDVEDKSGPYIAERIRDWAASSQITRNCVPDDVTAIQTAVLQEHTRCSLIIATGGTGLAPRDVTISAVSPLLEKHATGISAGLMAKCAQHTPFALLSNPLVGIKGSCLVVCLPGSKKAVAEYLDILIPLLRHILDLIGDEKTHVDAFHTKLPGVPHAPPAVGGSKVQHVCPHKTKHVDADGRRGVAFRPRHSVWPMLKVEEALEKIVMVAQEKSPKSSETKQLGTPDSISSAHGYSTAAAVIAREQVPNYRASIKDGYAVVSSDGPGVYAVVAVSQMGEGSGIVLEKGSVARVTTGAPVPLGADAVIQVEDTELVSSSGDGEELSIRVLKAVTPGTDIRPVGSDIQTGEVLLPEGTLLGASEIGLLAAQGLKTVIVRSKPSIAILSTGNELVQLETESLGYGKVRDSNSYALSHLLAEDGYTVSHFSHLPDTLEAVSTGLLAASKLADVVITTGGVSMGETDHLKDAISEIGGTVHIGRVFMKPGKPTTFASLPNRTLYFGLPGNPVSAMVTYKLFVLPALRTWEGRPSQPIVFPVKLPQSRHLDPRPEYVRAVYNEKGDVVVTGGQCSSRLLSMRSANVLLKLPPRTEDKRQIEEGSVVEAIVIGKL